MTEEIYKALLEASRARVASGKPGYPWPESDIFRIIGQALVDSSEVLNLCQQVDVMALGNLSKLEYPSDIAWRLLVGTDEQLDRVDPEVLTQFNAAVLPYMPQITALLDIYCDFQKLMGEG